MPFKKKLGVAVILCCALLGYVDAVDADCTAQRIHPPGDPFKVTMYDGTIGKSIIAMALQVNPDNTIKGLYAYTSSPSNITLTGKLEKGNKISLTEYNNTHNAAATFDGIFPGDQCEKFTGTWQDIKSQKKMPFELASSGSSGTDLEHLYDIVGGKNDLVEAGVMRFRNAVINNNKKVVAESFNYPITIAKFNIKNAAGLIKHYDAIFTPTVISTIHDTVPHLMFSNSQGVMISGGLVWFDSNGKVEAMNVVN